MSILNVSVPMTRNFTEIKVNDNDTMENIIEEFKNKWNVKDWMKGFFADEYVYDINLHWMKFDPPKKEHFLVLAVLYIIIMVIGIVGNFLVVFLFVRNKSLRTPANILIVNLAISDGLMMCKLPLFIYNSFHRGPILGNIACRIFGFVGGLSGTVSIVTLAAISFDRYFVISYPLRRRFTKLRIKISVICAWIYGLAVSAIQLFDIGLGKYQYEGYLISCSFDYLTDNKATRIFIMVFFVAAWVIPFVLITFCYMKIFQVVTQRPFLSPSKKESFRHTKEEDQRKQETKLAIIVLGVIFLWIFSWTPYSVIALFGISGRKDLITPMSSMIPALFCKTASAIDPYVYAISHPKFREHLMKMFVRKRPDKQNVWSCEMSKLSTDKSRTNPKDDNVEEELIDFELSMSDENRFEYKSIGIHDAALPKQSSSNPLMICFKPSFSNRSSNLSKLSRTLTSLSTSRRKKGSKNDD